MGMSKQLYPTDLTDSQWHLIDNLIPKARPGGRPRSLDMRKVVDAILYVVVTGAQWRMLPREYPAGRASTTTFALGDSVATGNASTTRCGPF